MRTQLVGMQMTRTQMVAMQMAGMQRVPVRWHQASPAPPD